MYLRFNVGSKYRTGSKWKFETFLISTIKHSTFSDATTGCNASRCVLLNQTFFFDGVSFYLTFEALMSPHLRPAESFRTGTWTLYRVSVHLSYICCAAWHNPSEERLKMEPDERRIQRKPPVSWQTCKLWREKEVHKAQWAHGWLKDLFLSVGFLVTVVFTLFFKSFYFAAVVFILL